MAAARKNLANLARGVLRKIGVRTVTKTMHGGPVRVPIAFGKLTSLLFDSDYMTSYGEEEVIDFMLSRVKPDDVVFDIGAFYGLHAVLFARVAGNVVAFEPNPPTFRILQETIKANRARNVIACPVAIGGKTETADLWGTGSASSLRPDINGLQKSRVNVVTLDSFAETRGVLPDVIKIDVEGAEHQLLVGAANCLKNCRMLCVEIHVQQLPRFGASPEMVYAWLAERGFKEIFRRTSQRQGVEDLSRLHVIFVKTLDARSESRAYPIG